MKPDDRMRDFWKQADSRPATRDEGMGTWDIDRAALAERLEEYNRKRARDMALQRLVWWASWIVVVLFVLGAIWFASTNA